jgi:hypothetical protein
MSHVLFLIFAALVMIQPNAQTADAAGLITAAQFLTLSGTVLTIKPRKPKQ